MAVPEEMVTTPEQLARCVARLSGEARLGLDTEFVGESTFHPALCLVQVASESALYLIDPLSCGPLDGLWGLFADPGRVTIVHAGREEIRVCARQSGHAPGRLFDVQIAGGLVGLGYPLSHAALAQQVLGVSLAKGETLTDWRQRPLSKAQVRYAFDDVRHLMALHATLAAKLGRLGRLPWLDEECTRLIEHSTGDPAVEVERWRKLRGLGGLDRRQLALVRSLFAWREELAREQNRPPRTVLRDDLLVEVARRAPARERDLTALRGLPKGEFGALLDLVAAAKRLPLSECPPPVEREADAPQVPLLVSLLSAVLGDFCLREKLTLGQVASMSDLRDAVRLCLLGGDPASIELGRGWRGMAVLPELLAFLNGQRSLRVGDIRSANPLSVEAIGGP